MGSAWTGRSVAFLVCAFALAPASAQRAGGGGSRGSTGSGAGSVGSTTRSPSTTFPNSTSNPSSPNIWQPSRPIFLSGRVLFDDGMRPNSDVRVERVCNGVARLEGHTDSRGQFSFQVGQNAMVDTDAADPMSPAGYGRSGGSLGNAEVGGMGRGSGSGSNPMWGCELRASYPGYRSDQLDLASHRSDDDPNVGTIILHRLGGSPGGAISVAAELTPKHAQKEYEKGVQLAEKGKFEEAEKHFESATEEYPKYAMAWFALGQVQQRDGHPEGAKKSYEAAIAAESKYASPYDQLALLSAQAQDWQAAANYSRHAIDLDASAYPSSLWYNAVANYQLKRTDEVEKSVRELLKIDKAHRYPEAEKLYAQVLLVKGDNAEAATHLRAYMALAPNAKDAEAIKQALAKLDEANAKPGQ